MRDLGVWRHGLGLIVGLAAAAGSLAGHDPDPVDEYGDAALAAFFANDYPAAEKHWAAAARLLKDRPGDRSRYSAILNCLGSARLKTEKYAAAEETFREALRAAEGADGAKSDAAALAGFNLGQALGLLGRYREAERHYGAAWAAYEASMPRDVGGRAGVLCRLGQLYLAAGRLDDADRCCRSAAGLWEADGTTGMHLANAYRFRGEVETRRGRFAEASALLDRAEREEGDVRLQRGRLHAAAGRHRQAVEVLSQQLEEERRGRPADRLYCARVQEALGLARAGAGDRAGGVRDLSAAAAEYERLLGKDHPQIAAVLEALESLSPDAGGGRAERAAEIRRANKGREPLGIDATLPKGVVK